MTSTPNAALMQHYGTESVFLEKKAGAASLLERLAGGAMGVGLWHHNAQSLAKQQQQAEQMNEMLRELELARVDQAGQTLRFTPVPRFAPSFVPPGWDQGMVRLASVAAQAGADMAKEAGLGGFSDFMKSMVPALEGAGQKLTSAFNTAAPQLGQASSGLLSKGKEMLGGRLGLGLKGNLALAGIAAGGLALGSKGIQKATQTMGEEAGGPAVYGAGRHGYQLSYGVNQYGQPQLGTPL